MGVFDTFAISAGGMTAQRARMDVIASNLANASTTKTPEGTPYRRRDVVLMSETPTDFKQTLSGVMVEKIVEDPSPFPRKYEPGNPNADKDGFVLYPNIDPIEEMVNLLSSVRSYEANVTSMSALKEMMMKALEIGR